MWENDAEIADNSWTEMDLDISAIADGESTVFLRWTMGTTDGGWVYCGWNIDDVEMLGVRSIEATLLTDGFESGDTTNWTTTVP